MSIDQILEKDSSSLEDTLRIAEEFGAKLKGGEVLQLVGDLGSGKTVFVRGLAKGIGSPDQVASPTFTISRVYKSPKNLELHHYDFYRLDDAGILLEEIKELSKDPQVIVAIEWSDIVERVLPPDTIKVEIKAEGEEARHIKITRKQLP